MVLSLLVHWGCLHLLLLVVPSQLLLIVLLVVGRRLLLLLVRVVLVGWAWRPLVVGCLPRVVSLLPNRRAGSSGGAGQRGPCAHRLLEAPGLRDLVNRGPHLLLGAAQVAATEVPGTWAATLVRATHAVHVVRLVRVVLLILLLVLLVASQVLVGASGGPTGVLQGAGLHRAGRGAAAASGVGSAASVATRGVGGALLPPTGATVTVLLTLGLLLVAALPVVLLRSSLGALAVAVSVGRGLSWGDVLELAHLAPVAPLGCGEVFAHTGGSLVLAATPPSKTPW